MKTSERIQKETQQLTNKIRAIWEKAQNDGYLIIGDGITIVRKYKDENGKTMECVSVMEP